jgi:glycine cleavage system H protein
MNFPSNLKYTEDHEWIRVEEGGLAYVGISDFAQSELGEIVYVEVDAMDDELEKDQEFGTVEAVKTTADLLIPISGKVIEYNEQLEEKPELVNEDPYGEGWIMKMEIANPEELEELMDSATYEAKVAASE